MGALERAQALIEKADPERTLPLCGIKEICIGPDELLYVRERVISLLGVDPAIQILFIADKTPIYRAGVAVKPFVISELEKSFSVHAIVLDDGHSELHASDSVIEVAAKESLGMAAIISLGGGTITDIGKMASLAVGGIAHVAIQTAASVDGYTDNVSVILRNGVKRTVPSRWPEIVIADTTLISQAPASMNRAGFGEINSMFTAPADWYLAALLGFEDKFHWGPIELLRGVGEGIEEWSPGLKTAEVEATGQLVHALAVRGIATGVADTTACLSGIEHLISHMFDISQGARNRPMGLHGGQVGVGSLLAACIWELIFIKFDTSKAEIPTLPVRSQTHQEVIDVFHFLDTSDRLGSECWSDYEQKFSKWASNANQIQSVLGDWQSHKDQLRALIRTPEYIAQGLRSSGSPTLFTDLVPAIDGDLVRWALKYCHLMRNRFVGTDLLNFFGCWTDVEVEWVIGRAAEAGRNVERSS